MDECIKANAHLALRPYLEDLKKQVIQKLREESNIPRRIPKSELQIDKEAQDQIDAFQQLLVSDEEITGIEKGFALAIEELAKDPRLEPVLSDLLEAANRLMAPEEASDESDLPLYNTIQEMLGLKDETYNAIYAIGSTFFNMNKLEEAGHIFTFLTTLNNFVFEPWLGLGCCCQVQQRFPEALRAFSMASLINFQHPAPHLYAAQVYLQMGDQRLARETLDLAISKMQPADLTDFKSHIEYVKNGLAKTKKGGG